jgi:hypothetical protein
MKLTRGRRLIAVGTVAVAIAVAIALASQAPGSGRPSAAPTAAGATRPEGAGRAGAVVSPRPPRSGVTVARSDPGRPLPAGFVGLSLEFKAVAAYTGPTSQPGARAADRGAGARAGARTEDRRRQHRLDVVAGSGLAPSWRGHVRPHAGPDGRLRVVLINKSLTRRRVIVLELRVASGVAAIQRLQAPSAASPAGVTIGGQSFGSQTATGELTGPAQTEFLAPRAGRYVVTVPRASAALITIPG